LQFLSAWQEHAAPISVLRHHHIFSFPNFTFRSMDFVHIHSSYKYYLVLLDDFTHYAWTFPLCQKSDILPILHSLFAYVRTQFGLPVLALQTNNGNKFDSTSVRHLLARLGAVFCLSCTYTSQQNGKVERILCLNDSIHTILIHSVAPLWFWAEALIP